MYILCPLEILLCWIEYAIIIVLSFHSVFNCAAPQFSLTESRSCSVTEPVQILITNSTYYNF